MNRFDDAADLSKKLWVDNYIRRWIAGGLSDDEIADQLSRIAPGAVRREALIRIWTLRGVAGNDPDGPTDWQRDKITQIKRAYPDLRRGSKSAAAKRVGIDRGTLANWISRGWLPWPPT